MWSSTPRSRPWQGRFWTLARPYTVERRPSRRGWMPPKATPGPTWPYQCTLDKSQLAKGINSSHCLLSKVFRSKFSPKILITFSSHRDVGFNCVSPVCSHCCSLNCIHRMFCLSVACSTFHCPSPPIPSHFPALNTSQCILHTADGALHPSCTAHYTLQCMFLHTICPVTQYYTHFT